MLNKWLRRLAGGIAIAAVVGLTAYALWPAAVPVDVATVASRPMTVTIDEDGLARIRDVFRISAPIAGTLERLPLHVGDPVKRDVTTVASIRPTAPAFLDVRTRRQMEAGVEAAVASVGLATAQLNGSLSAERMAEADLARAEPLARAGTISTRALEEARTNLETAKATTEQARATLNLRQSELDSARARLIEPDQALPASRDDMCCFTVAAPADGAVLRLLAESEQVVGPGTPLLEVGDPRDIEIVVHLLSSDAVNVGPGSLATLTEWGGKPLRAVVRRVDPAAYTKVSALGIEEQRVDAVLELTDPPEAWKGLGHSFRVVVRVEIWSQPQAVTVPIAALFRRGVEWSVFRVVDGRALATSVTVGHRNGEVAEVISGLTPGDIVVLHPSDRVTDGVAVERRGG